MREEPSPIDEDPTKFLNGLSLGPLFVHLHTGDGDLYLGDGGALDQRADRPWYTSGRDGVCLR